MIKKVFFVAQLIFTTHVLFAQLQPLPFITVKNINNKIIVSWVNNYFKPITTLNIQRSYDSLKNFSTIGTVLSPQSVENGYADVNAPYNKMYYRVFVAFEGGAYLITSAAKPQKDEADSNTVLGSNFPFYQNRDSGIIHPPNKFGIPYPSSNVFTTQDNNVIIHLIDTEKKKYRIKFFDETENFLFELTKLNEEYLIIEKVNFVHTGWFRFELYENGVLIENNKFLISKDLKKL